MKLRIAPQPGPQTLFQATTVDALLYGGAAGGGKTHILVQTGVMHALRSGDFSGIIFRRTYPELTQEGGPWPLLKRLGRATGGRVNESKMEVRWPHGAVFAARHMQHEETRHAYLGGEYSYVAFDELERFTPAMVAFLVQRMRSSAGLKPMLRMTCNPNPGWLSAVEPWLTEEGTLPRDHDLPLGWLSFRDGTPKAVIGDEKPGAGWMRYRVIPAWLDDNRYLGDDYREKLESTTEVERQKKLGGRWDIIEGDQLYRYARWEHADPSTLPALRWVRSWDMAASEPTPAYPDPDWTAGALVARHVGRDGIERIYLRDGRWCRRGPGGVEEFVQAAASEDGRHIPIVIEEEPGSAGKSQVDHYRRTILPRYEVRGHRPTGEKTSRQRPLVAAAERGEVVFVDADPQAEWIVQARRWASTYAIEGGGKRDYWDAVAQGWAEAPVTRELDTGRKRRHRSTGATVRPVRRI